MLKRLSGPFSKDSSEPALLLPPPPGPRSFSSSSPRTSPSLRAVSLPPVSPIQRTGRGVGASPGYPFPQQTAPPSPSHARSASGSQQGIERATLHKTLAALSGLLVALDELRDTKLAESKAERRVAKALKEVAGGFTEKGAGGAGGKSDVVVEALASASTMLDTLGEVDGKHAKAVQKEYEALNDRVSKFFKRTAKEEKAFEDTVAALDARVAKATSSYQSSAHAASSSSTRNMHAALDSLTAQHSTYMHALSGLSGQIQQTKASYAAAIADRRESVAREVARVFCGLAEKEWQVKVEATKKGGGEKLGRVVSAGAWCEAGMESAAQYLASETAAAIASTDVGEPDVDRMATLRGPRAPSSSTVQTATTTTTSSSAHSSQLSTSSSATNAGRPPSPARRSRPTETFEPPNAARRDTTPRPALPNLDNGRSSDPQRPSYNSSRRSSRDVGGDVSPAISSGYRSEPSHDLHAQPRSASPGYAHGFSQQSAVDEVLRRPTPRYGSAPASGSGVGAVDEFGRTLRREGEDGERAARSSTAPQRQHSFVARMSAKYAGHGTRGAPEGTRSAEEQQPNMASHDHQPSAHRPLPPTHRHTFSGLEASFTSSSSLSPSSPTSPPLAHPQRPMFRSGAASSYRDSPHASYDSPAAEAAVPPARRPRAYEAAQPLPPVSSPPLNYSHDNTYEKQLGSPATGAWAEADFGPNALRGDGRRQEERWPFAGGAEEPQARSETRELHGVPGKGDESGYA
ncbi:hypothetical protein Rhopal_007534-T1 [Rhodotorula paludigena]|uniref:Uncharacterized protein n=1 Tax=Rhodotorula paludigena TaxID=86838 RepID=A0AAV5GWX0_9BASI|nr:hypothetical protein Rhopal_007534-T1 [Rhodotorula paludigena]